MSCKKCPNKENKNRITLQELGNAKEAFQEEVNAKRISQEQADQVLKKLGERLDQDSQDTVAAYQENLGQGMPISGEEVKRIRAEWKITEDGDDE